MIRCIGYLKSLKQLLSILLISCFIFGLGSFASATLSSVGLIKYPSSVNNQYDIGFLRGGGIISEFLGQSKGIVALDNQRLFWWDNNGLPYVYLKSNNRAPLVQGQYDTFYSCDLITGDSLPSNCSLVSIDYSGDMSFIQNIMTNFFKSVLEDDLVYYNSFNNQYIGATYEYNNNGLDICWNSSSIGKSLCFRGGYCYNEYQVCAGSFVNSKNYVDLTFGLLPYSEIGRAPGQAGYGGAGTSQGSSSTEITIGLTGDYSYTTCTQGEILGMLENQGFSKYMCYGGLDNFDLWSSTGSYSPMPGVGKRLSQILSYSNAWDSPQQWFEYWYGLYQDKDNPLYYTMWESYPAVYRTWFDMYSKYGNGKYFDSIREYCVMKVDLNLSPDVVYNGTQFKGVCDSIIDIRQNPGSYTTDSGGRIVGVNWVGVGQLSGDNKTATQFIQDFFNTIKAQINTNYDGPGFIPAYIILFMLALIFFRFISH